MGERFKQGWEAENIPFCLSEEDSRAGVEIKIYNEGYIKYKTDFESMEMVAIYIKKEHREKHLGTKWMKDLENYARSIGVKRIRIKASTNGRDDILGKFITSLGYNSIIDHRLWGKDL